MRGIIQVIVTRSKMAAFSPNTIVLALQLLEDWTTAQIDSILIRYKIESNAPPSAGSKATRIVMLARFLITNPPLTGPLGGGLVFEFVEEVIRDCAQHGYSISQELTRSLAIDGFQIDPNSKLASILPISTPIAVQVDVVDALLKKFAFTTSAGHLAQALSAHARSDWAAANSQARTFIESLFDEIALKLGAPSTATSSHLRKEFLAKLTPPFIDPALNEWDFAKKDGFVQGSWNRLHPTGSHPGLSDEDDSTFRIQLVHLIAYRFLKRLENYP